MKEYISEYWEDESSFAKSSPNKVRRKILSTLRKKHPEGLTLHELAKETDVSYETVSRYKTELVDSNFIKEVTKRKRGRGRPGQNDSENDSDGIKYVIDNANYLNYKDMFRLAPGNVKYPVEFSNFCNRLLDEENVKDLLGSLLYLVKRIQNRMKNSNDKESKRWTPTSDLCQCGASHEARDFVRALLLRVIDRFETSQDYLQFMKGNQYISEEYY